MVWNTTQSAFYSAIDAFNKGEETGEIQGENCNEKSEKSEKRDDFGKQRERLSKIAQNSGNEKGNFPKISPKTGNKREGTHKNPIRKGNESDDKISPRGGDEPESFRKKTNNPLNGKDFPGDLSKYCCPNRRACQGCSKAPLSELFSDKDMLLIAGLIFVLSRQNADEKLILALAFVLLT